MGAANLARMGAAWEEMGVETCKAEKVHFRLYRCSGVARPSDHSAQNVELAGVYIPPKAAGSKGQVM